MMRLQFQINRAELTKRMHGEVMRQLNREVMERHQFERLPRHFEETAYSEYKAKRRGAKYQSAKAKKYGHRKPNVYSGALLAAVKARVVIRATQYRGTLTTRGTPTHRLQDWQRREIETVSAKEQKREAVRMARDYKKLATSEKYRRKRSRRIK